MCRPLRREKERRGCCSSSRAFLTRPLEGLVAAMAETKQPALTKVDQLRPATASLTIVVKVLSSKLIATRGRSDGPPSRQLRLAECLVGDETGIIVFTARRDQVDLMKPDTTVILRNARVDIFKGSMRLAVDKWGGIEVTDPAEFSVREDCNFSLLEFEEVKVVED